MSKLVRCEPQPVTADEFLSDGSGLPEKIELVQGVIGPYSDAGKLTLLANWGADDVMRLTGPEIWRAALATYDKNQTS